MNRASAGYRLHPSRLSEWWYYCDEVGNADVLSLLEVYPPQSGEIRDTHLAQITCDYRTSSTAPIIVQIHQIDRAIG